MLIQKPTAITPGPTELASDFAKRQAIFDCHSRFANETGNLAVCLTGARLAGINSVFDKDAAHANGVFASIEAASGPGATSQVIVEDIIARLLIQVREGADPGSPVPSTMQFITSDPAVFVTQYAALQAAITSLKSLTYTVTSV